MQRNGQSMDESAIPQRGEEGGVRGAPSQAPRRVAGMPSPSRPQPSGAGSGQPGGTAGRAEEDWAALDPEQRVR